jgi:transcriptional regulator with XRE-family HTH domain
MYNTATLARNIRKARLYRNYSQDYLAYKLNMSQNGYSKIELGQSTLSVEKLIIIAQTLEVDIAKLITEPEISDDIASVNSIPVGPQLLEVICRTTGLGFAAIARVTDEKWVACSVLDKISFGLKSGDELMLETTICNEIRQSHHPVIIDDVKKDPLFASHHTPARYGFESYISMPIFRQDGTFFGTLCAIDPKPAKLNNPETIGLFKLFAELISFYLDVTERNAFSRQSEWDEAKVNAFKLNFAALLGVELPGSLMKILNVSLPVVKS